MRSTSSVRFMAVFVMTVLTMGLLSACSKEVLQAPAAEPPKAETKLPATESTQIPEPTREPTQTPQPSPVPPTATATTEILPLVISEPYVMQINSQAQIPVRSVFYAFYVENPNQDFGIESVRYSISLLDADGKILELLEDIYLPCLLPGQKIGIANHTQIEEGTVAKGQIRISEEGKLVARSELQLLLDNPLSVVNVRTTIPPFADDGVTEVTGVVQNPLDVDLDAPTVYAIAYDNAGNIIGGGSAWVGLLLPKDSSAFKNQMLIAGNADRIEAYATVINFSDLLNMNNPPDGASAPILLNGGYGKSIWGGTDAAILLTNPNSRHAVDVKFLMAAYGPDGSVLDAVWDSVKLSPNATTGFSRHMFTPQGVQIDRVDFKILAKRYEEADPASEFPYKVNSIQAGGYGQVVIGEITNPTADDLSGLTVHAIAYDDDGKIIGGNSVQLRNLPANSAAELRFDFTLTSAPAKVEFYPEIEIRPF